MKPVNLKMLNLQRFIGQILLQILILNFQIILFGEISI